MTSQPIYLERIFNAPISQVWKAITDKNEMKKWYFDLKEFKPEVGFKFTFLGGEDPCIQYLHLCEVTEVIHQNKLTYSWRYEGFEGISFVTFELFQVGEGTKLKLTHSGIESFPINNPDFAIGNFVEGWNQLLNNSLKEYLDTTKNKVVE